MPMVLACNRWEQVSSEDELPECMQKEKLNEFAQNHNFSSWFYTSSRQAYNVNKPFLALIYEVLKREKEGGK